MVNFKSQAFYSQERTPLPIAPTEYETRWLASLELPGFEPGLSNPYRIRYTNYAITTPV